MSTAISRDELRAAIDGGRATVVDALPSAAFKQRHLPGAINVVAEDRDEQVRAALPDPAAAIVTYSTDERCTRGPELADRLRDLGYRDVRTYVGGIEEWIAAGLPIAHTKTEGRLVVTEYISVDGVVEAPSGAEPFERVGWTDAFSRGPDGDRFKFDETMAADAQLLGRVTYEQFAAAWPSFEGELADYFNSMPKYVVSSTLTDPAWNNTRVIDGDVVQELDRLKQRYERDILVHGSPQLARTLIEHDLVDALHLLVYPVIVGAGKRLFDRTSDTKRLRLVETRTFGDGVQLLAYERAG